MKMNISPAFKYQFSNFLKNAFVIYLIIIVIIAAFISISGNSKVSFTGYSLTATIFLFVMGIVNIRSDLRLCLQYGVSRRTSFISELLAVLSASAILAIAGELLTGTAQTLWADNSNLFVADIYQLIYVGAEAATLTFGQHVLSALVNTSLLFCACLFGMFFSLMFWRLNKVWTIIVAVSIPLLINIVPIILHRMGVNLNPLINWIDSAPFNFIMFFLLTAALFGIIDWLLLRKANIREAK